MPRALVVQKSTKVYTSTGKEFGIATGSERHCAQEGCRGRRIYVRWPDGKLTMPCSKGLTTRPDGDQQIM